jgi:hypothetical protein
MTDVCQINPFEAKSNPYSKKSGVLADKTSPFTNSIFCPVLLQETGAALLLENGFAIEL